MQENTNKAIAINSVILYVRMAVTTLCSLFTTRFALQALGVNDFGLFSVVGGVISFVAVINTIMLSTTNRFIAVAIGKGDESEVNKIFNVCLVVHIAIAVFTAIVAFPIGDWYINRYVNYNGPIDNALMVYRLCLLGSIVSFVSVPYNGLLMAKERFVVFCSVDILSHLLKLGAAVLLLFYFEQKLLFYASTQAILTAIPVLIYWIYCAKVYPSIVKWHFIRDGKLYGEMFKFSGWIGYGAIATIGKNQGSQLLVNAFFNTAMNAALGVANTINGFITMFSHNITQPMAPQITKSYASGDLKRCNQLLVMSTKLAFLSMLLMSSPFFSDIDWILQTWLGKVPEYASLFAKLLVLDALISTFNAGIANVVFAHGKIAFFQLTVHTFKLIAIIVAFLVLKTGAAAPYIFYVYIAFSIINVVFIQIALHRVGGFSFWSLAKNSYIPSLIVSVLYVPILSVPMKVHPIIHMLIVLVYLSIIVLFVGFKKAERRYLFRALRNSLGKIRK